MSGALAFPFRALWWLLSAIAALLRGALASLIWLIRSLIGGLLWLLGTRLFLALPALGFLALLFQGENVAPLPFYGTIAAFVALHFLGRWLGPVIRPKRAKPTLRIPEPPVLTLQRRDPAPQQPQQRVIPAAAPPRLPSQPRLPRPSPVLQVIRPYHSAASPTEQQALAFLPEHVRRVISPTA